MSGGGITGYPWTKFAENFILRTIKFTAFIKSS